MKRFYRFCVSIVDESPDWLKFMVGFMFLLNFIELAARVLLFIIEAILKLYAR